jgi:hypothetical protein
MLILLGYGGIFHYSVIKTKMVVRLKKLPLPIFIRVKICVRHITIP